MIRLSCNKLIMCFNKYVLQFQACCCCCVGHYYYYYSNTQVLQFPPALYHYITAKLHKQVILVLNKVDLCPPPLVIAWKHYMTSQFPDLQMVCFTSHPGEPGSTGEETRRTTEWRTRHLILSDFFQRASVDGRDRLIWHLELIFVCFQFFRRSEWGAKLAGERPVVLSILWKLVKR